MKRVVLFVFVILLAFSVSAAFAGDGCSKEVKKACASSGAKKSCCPSKAKGDGEAKEASTDGEAKKVECPHSAKAATAEGEVKAEGHVCPEVKERAALKEFHNAMHPMHVALGEENFAGVKEGMPKLMATTEGISKFSCEGYDKCSDACRANFDGNKTALIDAVKVLAKTCKGDDNEMVNKQFETMHEAYITLAKTCVHEEKPAVESKVKKVEGEKKETY